MKIRKKNIQHCLAVTGLFIVILVAFFYDITFGGKTSKVGTMIAGSMPYGTYGQQGNYGDCCSTAYRETACMEEPYHQFLKKNFQKGIFPLWNPSQDCGVPTSLMMDAGVLFPLSAIVYLLPNSISMDVLMLMRMLFACLFMYWLMYVWEFSFLSRVTAALTFALTGPMVVCHSEITNVGLTLPLLFLTAFKAFSNGARRNYLFFSIAVALSVLGGHIEDVFFANLLLMLYILFLLWQKKGKGARETIKCVKSFILFYFLGIGLSAVVLWPFLADFAYAWTSHTKMCGSSSQPILEWTARLVTIFVPTFFREHIVAVNGDSYNWGGGYLGALVVLFCFLGLYAKKQRQLVLFFAIAAFFAYGMVSSSFYTKWIGYLPGFNLMRFPAHMLYVLIFLIAFLAGVGVEEIVTNPQKSLKRALGIGAGIVIFIIIYLFVYRNSEFFSQAFSASCFTFVILGMASLWLFVGMFFNKIKPKIIAGGLFFLLVVELFVYVPRCRPDRFNSFPKVPYIEFLKENTKDPYFRTQGLFLAFYRNTAMAYGIDSFVGSFAVSPRRYINLFNYLITPSVFTEICSEKSPDLREEVAEKGILSNSDILAAFNVKYLVFPAGSISSSELGRNRLIYDKEVQIFSLPSTLSLPSAIPRAYLAYDWIVKPKDQDEEILQLIEKNRLSVVPKVIIESIPGETIPVPQASDKEWIGFVKEEKRWPNGVVLKARTSQRCFLILLDAYFPGWKVWVDGRPAKIYPANYLFRAVFLPPGEHVIEFRFIPFWFYFSLFVTLSSLICCFYFL